MICDGVNRTRISQNKIILQNTNEVVCHPNNVFFLKVKRQDGFSLSTLSSQLTTFGTPESVLLRSIKEIKIPISPVTDIIKKSLARPTDCHRNFHDFTVAVRKNVKS